MRSGFTVVELLIVLFIGTILTAVGVQEFGETRAVYELRNARNSLLVAASRARSEATRQGRPVELVIDPAGDRIRIQTSNGIIHQVRPLIEYGAEMDTEDGNPVTVCYSAGGVVYQSCSSGSLPVEVTFTRGPYVQKAVVRPLGQVEATT